MERTTDPKYICYYCATFGGEVGKCDNCGIECCWHCLFHAGVEKHKNHDDVYILFCPKCFGGFIK